MHILFWDALSSSGTIRNLQTILFLLMLPHRASFPPVSGIFLLNLTFSKGCAFCWNLTCHSCQNIPSKQLHGSRCWFPGPILFFTLWILCHTVCVHLDFTSASGPSPRLQILMDFFSPILCPRDTILFLVAS